MSRIYGRLVLLEHQYMQPPVLYYMDDSGTRTIDHERTPFVPERPNHFALGAFWMVVGRLSADIEFDHPREPPQPSTTQNWRLPEEGQRTRVMVFIAGVLIVLGA